MKVTKQIDFRNLGRMPYARVHDLMLDLRSKRQKNLIPDTVLFLEHDAVITAGRRDSTQDLLVALATLKSKNISYIPTDRGGKLTYHGPGQLVIYFIVDIVALDISVDQLVRETLGTIQSFLKAEGIAAFYEKEHPGLWVGDQKIASAGFHIQKGVTTHGLSFNISNDLSAYELFIPCGISNKGVTSLRKLKSREYEMKNVIEILQQKITDFLAHPDRTSFS